MGQEHKEYTWNLIAKKLTGEASPEELLELEALLRDNPELHYPMQTIMDLWKSSGPEAQRIAEKAFDRHLDRMEELHLGFIPAPRTTKGNNSEGDGHPGTAVYRETATRAGIFDLLSTSAGRETQRRKILLTSAVCLLVLTATFILLRSGSGSKAPATILPKTESNKEVTTRNGTRTNLLLPDGTRVWLNAGSRLTYDKNYGAVLREVNLTGEAFFDVGHNPGVPFLIHTATIDIKVLGTRFNVKSYPSDKTTETTLIHGSIEVSIKDRPSETIILKPNEKLVVANDDSTLHRKNSTRPDRTANESLVTIRKPTYESSTGDIIETSWLENKLVFRDEEFSSLARQMERWYGVTFHFTNPAQEEWRFTGNFQKETIHQALDALKLTQNFNYTITEDQITIYDR